MEIQPFTGGPAVTHGYLVCDPNTGAGLVVDAPLDTAASVLEVVRQQRVELAALVLTHAHFDHLLDVPAYTRAGLPVWMHPADVPLLGVPQPALFGLPLEMPEVRVARELAEGEEIAVGPVTWRVLHTPGHSPGSISLYAPALSALIGGDVLFAGGMGRTDLPAADAATLYRTLARLADLPPDTVVYPGHGPTTTIGAERDWIRRLRGGSA